MKPGLPKWLTITNSKTQTRKIPSKKKLACVAGVRKERERGFWARGRMEKDGVPLFPSPSREVSCSNPLPFQTPATQAKGKIQSQKLCLPNHCQGDNVQLLFQERLRKQLKLLAITNREMMKQTEHGIDWEHQTWSVVMSISNSSPSLQTLYLS